MLLYERDPLRTTHSHFALKSGAGYRMRCVHIVLVLISLQRLGSAFSPRRRDVLGLGRSRRQLTAGVPPSTTINVDNDPSGLLNTTAWALVYTYPLVVFSNWAGAILVGHNINSFLHQRSLTSPGDTIVTKPNIDTLYSRAVLDLSSHDMVLTVPKINDGRYYVFPVYDPFGNCQAEIGVVNGDQAGQYLIRRASDAFVAPGYSNDTHYFNSSAYRGVVNLPGSYATMLLRILLLHNTTEDLNVVHRYQNVSILTQINRSAPLQQITNAAPPLQSLSLNGSFLGINSPAQQLEFAARIFPYSLPEIYSDRYRVSSILTRAGLASGHYHPLSGLSLTQAASIANASIAAAVHDPSCIRPQSNDWKLPLPSYQGNFGTHYAFAAALAGYQEQTASQVLYPGYKSLGFTSALTLEPGSALLLTFFGKPKLQKAGFWSLSVYGRDGGLIPNMLNRFEVGDRTYSLKYEDRELVYGPRANASKHGRFRVLVQSAMTEPPENWTGNWLPTAGNFSWNCENDLLLIEWRIMR